MLPSSTEERGQAPLVIGQAEPPSRTLGFSVYDRAAISSWVKGDAREIEALIEDARQLAEALAGRDGQASRQRLLSRAAAAARAQERVLSELLARTLAARDYAAVNILTRALEATTRRLVVLLKQLAVEDALRSRPSITITNVNNVAVAARYP